MKGLVWVIVVFVAAVVVSMMLKDGGYLVLVVPPWRIEVSLVLSILALIAAFAAFYWIVRLASHTLALPMHVRSFRSRQRERAGRRALMAALRAFFEGRFAQVEKYAAEAFNRGSAPALAGLVAARAAQRRRDFERRDEWMKRVGDSDPEWRRARMMLEAEQLIEERRYEEARLLLRDLQSGGARHVAATQMLLRCEQALGHWDESVRLARMLERREALSPEAVEGIVTRARTSELEHVLARCAQPARVLARPARRRAPSSAHRGSRRACAHPLRRLPLGVPRNRGGARSVLGQRARAAVCRMPRRRHAHSH